MKKILIFTGTRINDKESAIEGMCKKHLSNRLAVTFVYFDKQASHNDREGNCIVLKKWHSRFQLAQGLSEFVDLAEYDFIVVRNLFQVLRQILRLRLQAKTGFWESFPHSHARLERAQFERRAVLRKNVEYFVKSKLEKTLISQCDFYMPITQTHKRVYYDDLTIPCFPMPMGVDFSSIDIPNKTINQAQPVRFVYIGAICELRRLDIVNRAFLKTNKPFTFDYYSYDQNSAVDKIKNIDDPRIRFRGPMNRHDLFQEIANADVGVCFFPNTKTFITASPTKTLEYGALGMTLLVNEMPEYTNLLDDHCAYICDFKEHAITRALQTILDTPRQILKSKGLDCQRRIQEQRNYQNMAKAFFHFLIGLQQNRPSLEPTMPTHDHAKLLK